MATGLPKIHVTSQHNNSKVRIDKIGGGDKNREKQIVKALKLEKREIIKSQTTRERW